MNFVTLKCCGAHSCSKKEVIARIAKTFQIKVREFCLRKVTTSNKVKADNAVKYKKVFFKVNEEVKSQKIQTGNLKNVHESGGQVRLSVRIEDLEIHLKL